MADHSELSALPRRRRLVNQLTRYVVAAGGASVIAAIALIFFYLLWVISPILAPASIEPGEIFNIASEPKYVDASETGEVGLSLDAAGEAHFFDMTSGAALDDVPIGFPIRKVKPVLPMNGYYAVADVEDQLHIVAAEYRVSFANNVREVQPVIVHPFEEEPVELGPAADFDVYLGNLELLVAAVNNRQLTLWQYRDAEPGFALERPRKRKVTLDRPYSRVYFGPRARWLYLIDSAGMVELFDISRPTAPKTISTTRLVPEGAALTALAPLLGRYSLLAGDDTGQVTQWFVVRDEYGHNLQPARRFELPGTPVRIVPEQRRKGFAVLDDQGRIHLAYSTTGKVLADSITRVNEVAALNIGPRADRMLIAAPDGRVELLQLHNEHPEISWGTLWNKVWYEGYEEPVYSWQSSSADNDFEPKFSLTPLLYGTLKAAFYAMVVATPLAIMGALYTAYFMAPSMRRLVKPGIEIMAALPTVILGFMAGLWLAPIIEANLAAVLSVFILLPIGMLLVAFLWSLLPDRARLPFEGWYGLLAVIPLLLMGWFAFELGPVLERGLLGGDAKAWFLSELGLAYDQRNALVVGFAMGLAVIPTIFSIAEDAIYGVPTHLINGSLALGATPWQTLVRVVLLTASPGIFSAVMIGLGRAVGETMIVLMATGNTPVMNLNIFEGMRTFAANIAVELPESEVGSSHYRILFLAAMVLFLITFAFNTAAELVRQRLRARYGSL